MKKYLIIALASVGLSVLAVANFGRKGITISQPESDLRSKAAKILADLSRYYQEHPFFSADIQQLAFRDHFTADQPDTTTGNIQAWNAGRASVMMGIQTLENDQFCISIDTAESVIMLADRWQQPKLPDLEELERTLQYAQTLDIKQNESITEINMRFDPKEYPVQEMHITISKNRIATLKMWHAQEVAFDDGSVSKPRTEIRFFNYREGKKLLRKNPVLNDYISTGETAKIIHPAYMSYQLIDLRIKK